MSKTDVGCSANDGTEQTEKRDEKHREALIRFGQYTAPAMLAMLVSKQAGALPIISNPA